MMAAGMLGSRRAAVEAFLLEGLQASSQQAYNQALEDFEVFCLGQGVMFSKLDEERQDWLLAEHVLDLREADPVRRQRAVVLVSALMKIAPGRRYRTAHKVLERWAGELPSRQAPACPDRLLYAMVVLLQAWGEREAACVALLCFCGLLRVSECLRLTPRMIVAGHDYLLLLLGATKRGVEDRVLLSNPTVLNWVRSYLDWKSATDDEPIFRLGYWRFNRLLKDSAAALGFGVLALTSHSLRRGGATQLLRAGVGFADIAMFGRWASERSVREYLRQGEVAMTRASREFSREDWERLEAVIKLHSLAWRDASA